MRRLLIVACVGMWGGTACAQQVGSNSGATEGNSQPLFADYEPLVAEPQKGGTESPPLMDATPTPSPNPAPSPGPSPSPEPAPAPGPQIYYVPVQPVYRKPWTFEWSFSGGYSNIHFPHAGLPAFYDSSGGYFDANFAFALPRYSSPVLGFGITGSGYWDSRNDISSGTLFSDVDMISFEARLSAPIPADQDRGLFLLPRIGGGLIINDYAIDAPGGFNRVFTYFHDGAGGEVRPSVELGYRWARNFSAGIEGSYMWAWGDFGSLGHEAQEWRAGFVFSFRY